MPEVNVNGQIIRFPDDMQQEQIENVLRQQFSSQNAAQPAAQPAAQAEAPATQDISVNGQIMRFPANMPQEQIERVLQQQFPSEQAGAQSGGSMGIFNRPSNQEEALRSRENFTNIKDTFIKNMAERGAKAKEALALGASGQQSAGEAVGQAFAQGVIAPAIDIVGQAAGEVGEGAYRLLPQGAQQALGAAGKQFINSPVGKAGMQALNAGAEAYNQFKANYPRAARNLEALGLGVAGATPIKGKSILGVEKDLVKGVGKSGAKAFRAIVPSKVDIDEDISTALANFDEKANKVYTEAEQSGEYFSKDIQIRLLHELDRRKRGKFSITKDKDPLKEAAELTANLLDQPLSIQGAQQIDEELSHLIQKSYNYEKNEAQALKLMQVQDLFREDIEKAKGGKLLKKGRDLWVAKKQLEDLDRIFTTSKKTDNPATSLKAGLRVLSKSKARMAKYSEETQKLIEKGAESTKAANALRTAVGSRLLAFGGGAMLGGSVGATLGLAASSLARDVAYNMGKKNVKKMLDQIQTEAETGTGRRKRQTKASPMAQAIQTAESYRRKTKAKEETKAKEQNTEAEEKEDIVYLGGQTVKVKKDTALAKAIEAADKKRKESK